MNTLHPYPTHPRPFLNLLLVLSLAAAPASIRAASAASGEVIAQASGVELDDSAIRALLAPMSAADRAALGANPGALEQLVRGEMARRTILIEARSKGFERRPETQTQLDRLRDDALVRLWIADQSAPLAEYRLAQIFIRAPDGAKAGDTAAALRKAADLGAHVTAADFARLAREQSEHKESAANGGDMGFLAEDRLLPEVATAAHGMAVGEVLGPIKTAQGLHFLKLLEKRSAAPPTLAQAHDNLAAALRSRRAQELQQAYVASLGERLKITVNQIALARLQTSLK